MPKWNITTLEYWETIVEYEGVEANTLEEAIEMVKAGNIAYERHDHPGNDDQWAGVRETEECDED